MALHRTWFNIVLKNRRLFSAFNNQNVKRSWFEKAKELPVFTIFQETSNLNNEQWTSVREQLSNPEMEINVANKMPSLDAVIIQFCISAKNLKLAQSYMRYLRENKRELNIGLIGKYLQLMYNCRQALTDLDKKEVLNIYDNLRLKHPLLDAITAESCILAISLTERWRESIELLEMIKIACNPSGTCYSAIIAAAFKNGEAELGWKYFHETIKYKKKPQSVAYIAYLEYCLKNFRQKSDTCVQEIGKLFNFLAAHDLLPNEIFMEHIQKTFKTLDWRANFTTLTKLGVCLSCNHKLAPLKLSEKDFSELYEKVLEKVIVGKNIYFSSTPSEVQKFLNFVNKTKPYDVVIDGLNVAYMNKRNTANSAAQLASVVRYFMDKNKVVLVLGRKHMSTWNLQSMNYVKKNSYLFLVENLTTDDAYLLYATLASGPETAFVSRDLMREHKFVLEDASLQKMFKRWQMSHQYLIAQKDRMKLKPPLNYLPAAQEGENCWHIPCRHSGTPETDSYEPPKHWLCLERKKRKISM